MIQYHNTQNTLLDLTFLNTFRILAYPSLLFQLTAARHASNYGLGTLMLSGL